jgi:hypothetical protein
MTLSANAVNFYPRRRCSAKQRHYFRRSSDILPDADFLRSFENPMFLADKTW